MNDLTIDRLTTRLPLKARRKLAKWAQDEIDSAALRLADSERLIELQSQKAGYTRELVELQKSDHRGLLVTKKQQPDPDRPGETMTVVERDDARLEAAKRRVQLVQDQIERLNARRSESSVNPRTHLEAYLRRLPPALPLVEHDGPAAKRKPNETWLAAVERTRDAIGDLTHQTRSVEVAPMPSGEARTKAKQEIERLANSGRPGALALLERAGGIAWPVSPLRGVALTDGNIPQIVDALALIAWLLPKEMTAAVERAVSEDADDDNALTDAQRKARFKQIADQILALSRDEENLIEQAEGEGIAIVRRGDADPRAVLGLVSSLPSPEKRS